MEFIPLERYSGKGTRREREDKDVVESKKKKLKQNDEGKDITTRKLKTKPQPKVIEKKNVKNKYREALELKRKEKISKKFKKKILKKNVESDEEDAQPKKKRKVNFAVEEEEDEDEDDDDDDDDEEEEEEKEEVEKDDEVEEEEEGDDENNDETENQNEEELDSEEIAFQKKCKELDEKKKNRLFVKLKKKIHSEAQIKELHPDIKGVIFPRKKNSRWCWAVFVSQEKAIEAFKILKKNKEILVSKPDPHEKVIMRMKDKMVTIKRKKEGRKKLEKMWT